MRFSTFFYPTTPPGPQVNRQKRFRKIFAKIFEPIQAYSKYFEFGFDFAQIFDHKVLKFPMILPQNLSSKVIFQVFGILISFFKNNERAFKNSAVCLTRGVKNLGLVNPRLNLILQIFSFMICVPP